MITTPVNSHKVGILILYSSCHQSPKYHLFGFAKFKFSLSSRIFIVTSDSSLPKVYVLINSYASTQQARPPFSGNLPISVMMVRPMMSKWLQLHSYLREREFLGGKITIPFDFAQVFFSVYQPSRLNKY